MENYSYSSYNSGDSSPRSREIDCENRSWDEAPPNYKVKFMCSYGGKIHPRPHDNQLAYIGGDTKILAVDRYIKFPALLSKLSSLCDNPDICFKYQLPGEDLDALISVTNDEDLEHMMLEYDRMYRASPKPARLRLFLFPLNPSPVQTVVAEGKPDRQWLVDALNSVPAPQPPPAVSAGNPDYLFGLDKGVSPAPTQMVPDPVQKDISAGSDCGSEPVASPTEIQRQIQDLQRLQISQRKADEGNPRAFTEEYYSQTMPEKIVPPPAPAPVPMPMPVHPGYHGNYSVGATMGGTEQPVYLISTSAGVYQTPGMRPVTGTPTGQPYYGVQRMVQEVYREQPVYNQAPAPPQKVAGYGEGMGMMQQKVEQGYIQVGYDAAGRQVYYTTQPGGVVVPPYQTAASMVDGKPVGVGVGGAVNQEGKVVAKVSQASV